MDSLTRFKNSALFDEYLDGIELSELEGMMEKGGEGGKGEGQFVF